jgi:formylglycine-generating enzyme required for sulfatase activity
MHDPLGNDLTSGPSPVSSAAAQKLQPGDRIADRYEVRSLFGRGGMGQVYLCLDTRLNRSVAVKRLLHGGNAPQGASERFRMEARAIAQLNHPGIVGIYDADADHNGPYFAMEYLEGRDLAALVREKGPLAETDVIRTGIEICLALEYAHSRSVVHRDIKPSNLFRLPDGSTKLLDFGLARGDDETGQVAVGMGTLDYMAPEQARDARVADARSDLFSVGTTLYFLCSGRPPKSMRPQHIPVALQPIIERLTEENPGDRYASAAEVAEALRNLGSGGTKPMSPATVVPDNQILCRHCSRPNPRMPGVMYCIECGKDLYLRCLQCKEPDALGARFCGKCGHDLSRQREYDTLCAAAVKAMEARDWGSADGHLRQALALKLADKRADDLNKQLTASRAEHDRVLRALEQAEAKKDLAALDAALSALRALVPERSVRVLEWEGRRMSMAMALENLQRMAQIAAESAGALEAARDWQGAMNAWAQVVDVTHDRVHDQARRRCAAALDEIAHLHKTVPGLARELQLAQLEAAVARYCELVTADDELAKQWTIGVLPSTRAAVTRLQREAQDWMAQATQAEQQRRWEAAADAYARAEQTGVAGESAGLGRQRALQAIAAIQDHGVSTERAFEQLNLEELERRCGQLLALLPSDDPSIPLIHSERLQPAREAHAKAVEWTARGQKQLEQDSWEEALASAQEAVQAWRTYAPASELLNTATVRLQGWNALVAQAELSLRNRNVGLLVAGLNELRGLRKSHPTLQQLERQLVKLNKSRRNRRLAAAGFVLTAIAAWAWLAGARYASVLAQDERNALQAQRDAAQAIEALELVRAHELLANAGALAFDREGALERVAALHAQSSLAWLPQPSFVVSLGLLGLREQDLKAGLPELQKSWEDKRRTYLAALAQVHEALATESFVKAAEVARTLPTFGKDDPRNAELVQLVDTLRPLATQLAVLEYEVIKRLANADLTGARRIFNEREALRQDWAKAQPVGYQGTTAWPRPESSAGAKVQEREQEYAAFSAQFQLASQSLDRRAMESLMRQMERYQKDDPEIVARTGALAEVTRLTKQADDVCQAVQSRISARDIEGARGVLQQLTEAQLALFERTCAAEGVYTRALYEYESAIDMLESALGHGDAKVAAVELAKVQLRQQAGPVIENFQRRLGLLRTQRMAVEESAAAIEATLESGDVDGAIEAWNRLDSNSITGALGMLEPRLRKAALELDSAQTALEVALQERDDQRVADALKALLTLQKSGERARVARDAVNVFRNERRNEISEVMQPLSQAVADKEIDAARSHLKRLREILGPARTTVWKSQWDSAESSVRALEAPKAQPAPRSPAARTSADVAVWADVVAQEPDFQVVRDLDWRKRIMATGLPWRVKTKRGGIEMVLIPAGSYTRGADRSEDYPIASAAQPAHAVTISQPFYMSVHEVTAKQWLVGGGGATTMLVKDLYPVEATWDVVVQYAQRNDLRLPTEAEWEYAARAGSTKPLYGPVESIAWHAHNGNAPQEVGQKRANALGLYDLYGNLSEWCSDIYSAETYASCRGGVVDPDYQGPGVGHVLRGGDYSGRFFAASMRYSGDVGGVRLVRNP